MFWECPGAEYARRSGSSASSVGMLAGGIRSGGIFRSLWKSLFTVAVNSLSLAISLKGKVFNGVTYVLILIYLVVGKSVSYGDGLYILCLVVPIRWFPVVWGYLIPVSSVVLWFLLLALSALLRLLPMGVVGLGFLVFLLGSYR